MGKRKSVALIVLITIVLVAFTVLTVLPAFSYLTDSGYNKWLGGAVGQYDLDADLGGEYYTYYYPQGVKSALDYDEDTDGDKYVPYKSLYLSLDEDDAVFKRNDQGEIVEANGEKVVSDYFKSDFETTKNEIVSRFENMKLSSFTVSTVDDFALRVSLPVSDANSQTETAVKTLAYMGGFNLYDGENMIFPLAGENPADYFKGFESGVSSLQVPFITIRLTELGESKIYALTKTMSSDSKTALQFRVGEETVLSVNVSGGMEAIDGALTFSSENFALITVRANASLLNSALTLDDNYLTLNSSALLRHDVSDEKISTKVYFAVAIATVLTIAVLIIAYHGFGVSVAYSVLLHFALTVFSFAFISEGVIEVSSGTVLFYFAGLAVIFITASLVYSNVKKNVGLRKTIESSTKLAFKKSLLPTVDICAVFVLSALALLIMNAGFDFLSIQALLSAGVSAFASLLFIRLMNALFINASKDKYKYFGFVREDKDDD